MYRKITIALLFLLIWAHSAPQQAWAGGVTYDEDSWPYDLIDGSIVPPLMIDFNFDGQKELIVATTEGTIHVIGISGNVEQEFSLYWPLELDQTVRVPMAAADIDDDGLLDLVIVADDGYRSYLHVLNWTGKDRIDPFPVEFNGVSDQEPVICDIDGDGRAEIIVTVADRIYLIRAGDSTFSASFPVFQATLNQNFTVAPTLLDYDLDGFPELIVGTSSGKVEMLYYRPADERFVNDNFISWNPSSLSSQINHPITALQGYETARPWVAFTLSELSDTYIWDSTADSVDVHEHIIDTGRYKTVSSPVFAELSPDDKGLELVLLTADGTIFVRNSLDYTITPEGLWPQKSVLGGYNHGPLVVNFDDDPEPEIITVNDLGFIQVLEHDGKPYNNLYFPLQLGGEMISAYPLIGDMDNDGTAELAVLLHDKLHLVHIDTDTLAPNTLWPMYKRDRNLTGNAEAGPLNTRPLAPENISPESGAKDITFRPNLQVSGLKDIDGDQIVSGHWQIASSSSFAAESMVLDEAGAPESFLVPDDILWGDIRYYWRVQVQDARGRWSDFSTPTWFLVDPLDSNPEQPVAISSLTHGNTAADFSVDLIATAFVDPDSGDLHYSSHWLVSLDSTAFDSNDTTLVVYNQVASDNLITLSLSGFFVEGRKYFWKVAYTDRGARQSPYSDIAAFYSFGEPNIAPDMTVNVQPINGVKLRTVTPQLLASPYIDQDDDAHTASLWEIFDDSGALGDAHRLYSSGWQSGSLIWHQLPAGVLEWGRSYYWRVKYQDARGSSSMQYSRVTVFNIIKLDDLRPAKPVWQSPVGSPILEWADFPLALEASAYFDVEGNPHQASTWQVKDKNQNLVWSSGLDSTNLTQMTIGALWAQDNLQAGQTYSWQVQYLEYRADDIAPFASDFSESNYIRIKREVSHLPAQPVNISPPEGFTAFSNSIITLQSSYFQEQDGDAHIATWWQISASDFDSSSLVLNLTADAKTLAHIMIVNQLPENFFNQAGTYYWRVAHQDDYDGWSDFSRPSSIVAQLPQVAVQDKPTDASGDSGGCFVAQASAVPAGKVLVRLENILLDLLN